ncbi:ATP-binding protein [Alicyclobacillus tolerans]|uniref:histidine kinase n=1 Tax=Alicyclobacillus tolerans TaxID=90970 RepID=A0ABT9LYS0_9BACL|nr:ATP-binding protein [Alicyclobacillus tengchongensis]MDP9729406.1 two-component system sensor histidine kinase KdpD [Alicyclobacillus tengchongensis]
MKSFSPKWQILDSTHKGSRKSYIAFIKKIPIIRYLISNKNRLTAYTVTIGMNGVLTLLLFIIGFTYDRVNIAMLYLLPVLIASVTYGLGPGILSACLGLLLFDFFFIPPIFSYSVSDLRFLVSFAVFLTVAILTASLASQMRRRAEEAKRREAIANTLYSLSRQLAANSQIEAIINLILQFVENAFDTQAMIALSQEKEFKYYFSTTHDQQVMAKTDQYILKWVFRHGQTAGLGSKTYQSAALLYIPLKADENNYGVLCIGEPGNYTISTHRDHIEILHAIAGLAAISLARIHYEEQAQLAHLAAESERLRTALINSISHELKTPLTTIIGASGGLIDSFDKLSIEDSLELISTIREGAMRMNRLVSNLIGMMRIESGMMQLKRRETDILDILGVALADLKEILQTHPVHISTVGDIPEMYLDELLLEQVLVNIISNAAKYSEQDSPIDISIQKDVQHLHIEVRDYGIGIPDDEKHLIFNKFYRASNTTHISGTGLGLAICHSVIEAHGGKIRAENAFPRGTRIIVQLPIQFVHSQKIRKDDKN